MVVRHMRQRFHCNFPPSALFMKIRERTSANPMTEDEVAEEVEAARRDFLMSATQKTRKWLNR